MNEQLLELEKLSNEISVCTKCQLHLSRKKSVPGEGNIRTRILFIGEGPGLNENETGRPFVGQAGNFLNELLATAGLKRQDVFITNVVKCRPPANRDPMPEELKACSGYLDRQIALIDPLIIVTLGRFSMGRYFPLKRISAIHGQGHWIEGKMIVPMFHPAAALHQPNLRNSIVHDFSLLPQYLETAQNTLNPTPEAEIPTETDNAEEALANAVAEEKKAAADPQQLSLF